MEFRSDNTLADVPRRLEEWKRKLDPRGALLARAALTDACESILGCAEKEARGLTPTEQRAFDIYAMQAREITAALTEYRRAAEADLVAAGFPAEWCRYPF